MVHTAVHSGTIYLFYWRNIGMKFTASPI
jgi:hypothetical protein